MSAWSSVRSWLRPGNARRGDTADRGRPAPIFRPMLEELETREAPGSLLGLPAGTGASLAVPSWSSDDLSSADPFPSDSQAAGDSSAAVQPNAGAPAAPPPRAGAPAAGGAGAHVTIGAGQASADPFALPAFENQGQAGVAFNKDMANAVLSGPVAAPKDSGPPPLPVAMPIPAHSNNSVTPTDSAMPVVSPSAISLSSGAWTQIGPAPVANGQVPGTNPVSGRVAGLAADPGNPNIIYMAAAGGGVWKTTDGGNTWAPLTDNQSTLFMGAIAVAPSNPNIIYAGTGESTNSGLSFYGRGVLVSTDAGATWTLDTNGGAFDRKTFSKIVVDPTNANIVYGAVADGGVNGVAGNTGIWKSMDGGVTWTNTTTAIPGVTGNSEFSDLVINPANANQLFCAIGNAFGGGAENGVYVTNNAGATWAAAGNFTGGVTTGNIKIDISRSTPTTLYAAVATPAGDVDFIAKTVDGGTTWVNTTMPPDYMSDPPPQGWYDNTLAIDPTNPNTVFLGGAGDPVNAVQETTDGGVTWNAITVGVSGTDGPHADHHAMVFDAAGKLLDGNDGGIWRLQNPNPAAIAWTDLNGNLATLQAIGLALNPSNASIAYIGTQDNGTDQYTGTLPWTQVRGGDGGFVRVDPSNPLIVYHTYAGDGAGFIERSNDGGATWTDISTGINPGGTDNSDFYVPYKIDPNNSDRLILGTDHLYESTNDGASWTAIAAIGANGFNINFTVDAIGVLGNTIYVGDDQGNIFVTNNDGASWVQRNIPGVSDHINDFVVDPTNANSVYAVRDRFGGPGKVFHSADGGVTWTDITGNLPDLPTYSLAVDITNNILYIGNDNGVYASANGGASWSVFGTGLPNVQVRQLELNTALGVLAAGTHGRSVWEISTAGGGGGGGGAVSGGGIAVEPEPNQTSDTATNFGALKVGGTTTATNEGIVTLPDGRNDYDWYRWTAVQAGTFTATEQSGGNLELHLFTLQGDTLVQLANAVTSGVASSTLSTAVAAGQVILVEVKGQNTSFGKMSQGVYNLTATLA